jgi:signal recognition particle GTPase
MKKKDQEAIARLYMESNWEHEPYSSDYNDQKEHESKIDSEDENSPLNKLANELNYPVNALGNTIKRLSKSETLRSVIEGDNYLGLYSFPLSLEDFTNITKEIFTNINPQKRPTSSHLTSLIEDYVAKIIRWNNQDSESGGY